MYACSVDEWNSCMPLLVSLCCIVMCYRNDEMSKQTRQGFPVWETPRQCKSKGVIDSSIIPHHWPGHPHAPTPLGLYKPATQQQRIQPHTPLYADITAWQGIFQIISFHWLAHTDRQYFSCAKRMNCFGLESQDNHSSQVSISWLSELSWHKSKEGLQDKLWIRARVLMNVPALPFLSSCVPSAPSSTLPPASLNTHTTAYMVTKAMVTSLSTAAICVERVSIRAWRRLWLKILGLQHAQTESDGRTEAERTGQDEKKNCSI